MKFTRYYVNECYNDAITLPPTEVPIMLVFGNTTSIRCGILKADWDYELISFVSLDGSKDYYMKEMMNGTPLYAFRLDEVEEILRYFPWLKDKTTEKIGEK